MIVRHPLVLAGLALVAIPIAIHLLVRAPAKTIDLPSLRFVRSSPMRALRRHVLDDGGLLVLRMIILAAAVAALADPLVLAGCRRDAWNARLVRALVVDTSGGDGTDARGSRLPPADVTTRIETTDLDDGLRRAQAWLAGAPAGRREIVVSSPFRLGTLDDRAIALVPPAIGLRFEPRAPGPTASSTAGPAWSAWIGTGPVRLPTTLTLDGPMTRIEAGRAEPLALATLEAPGAVVVPALGLRVEGGTTSAAGDGIPPVNAARAALHAVIAAGVAIETTDAAARLAQARPITLRVGAAAASGARPSSPWMAAVIRAIASDADLVSMTASERATATGGVVATPILRDAAGAPLVSAEAGVDRPPVLIVHAHVAATSVVVPSLLRALMATRSSDIDLRAIEPLQIPADRLSAWTREPGPIDDRAIPIAGSDRRWAWALVLLALGAETVWRRRRGSARTGASGEGAHAA